MSYQQIPNEKGIYDAPPPYAPEPSAPLLPPPATATTIMISERSKKTSCCGVVCSVVAITVTLFLCCCCFVALILGVIFGVWASQCSDLSYQLTLDHQATLNGAGPKSISIRNFGSLEVNSVLIATSDIKTISEISASSYSEALGANLDNDVTPTSFTLEFSSPLWSCTSQDITAELFDKAALSPMALSLQSSSGPITLQGFVNLGFSEVEIFGRSEGITFGFLNVTDKLTIESINGDIKSTSPTLASEVDLQIFNGNIDINSLSLREFEAEAVDGDIKVGEIIILGGAGECQVEVESRSGDVDISAIRLLAISAFSCKLEFEALSGDVKLNIYNFAGTYSIVSSGGEASLNGSRCPKDVCEGEVAGGSHTLEVRAYSGDAEVAFL